jgi:aminotransferase in exopolysaccharide biosynthesis
MEKFRETVDFIKQLYPDQSFIPLHEPRFIGKEREYVMDAIDSTFVSSVGRYVDLFEEKIKEYTGAKYAIAVVNGTAALHMSLMLAGVKRDEIVVTQALSFIATCNAISYIGAIPAFVDVDKNRLGMSAFALEEFLKNVTLIDGQAIHSPTGKRVAACVPMHTFGHPVEIDKIVELCNAYNIPVVEDAAESLGSTYKNQHTGTFGLLGTYSFNGNKTITCGGGGMIVTNDDHLGKMAKHLTTQAKVPHRWDFVHNHIGYNYRCPNLNAALAVAQLEQLEKFIENKRNTAHSYQKYFNEKGIQFIAEPAASRSNFWLNAILLNSEQERNEFLSYTNDNGVMTRPAWRLMHKLDMFKDCIHDNLENSIFIEERLVNIPSSVRTNIV